MWSQGSLLFDRCSLLLVFLPMLLLLLLLLLLLALLLFLQVVGSLGHQHPHHVGGDQLGREQHRGDPALGRRRRRRRRRRRTRASVAAPGATVT